MILFCAGPTFDIAEDFVQGCITLHIDSQKEQIWHFQSVFLECNYSISPPIKALMIEDHCRLELKQIDLAKDTLLEIF